MEAELLALVRSLAVNAPVTPYVGGDEGEQAAVNVAYWVLSKGQGRAIARVHALRAALERLDAGPTVYGVCLGCGDPINPRRLEVLPEAERCSTCQSEREREAERGARRASDEEE